MPNSSSSKPRPADVAAEAKRVFIPSIRSKSHLYQISSVLYSNPLEDLDLGNLTRPYPRLPIFYVQQGDPVLSAFEWSCSINSDPSYYGTIPFICSANDKRPGGDWETSVVGYEECLCRRSSLSATLATPSPESDGETHYPIPIEGGIMSDQVVVFRGVHDTYEKLKSDSWYTVPVCSVAPERRPKLKQSGIEYSFEEERNIVKNKIRAALHICVHRGYSRMVVGDFGLGNTYRNPPRVMAELWREVLLWDADLRGRIQAIAFVFEDPTQSTAQLILDDIAKKSRQAISTRGRRGSRGGVGALSSSSSSAAAAAATAAAAAAAAATSDSLPLNASGLIPSAMSASPTDFDIFQYIFSSEEVRRYMTQPDSRYELGTLMSPT